MSEPVSPSHVPTVVVRTCVGCRARSDRHELLRVVVVPVLDGASGPPRAEPDVHARRPGRGAWIHPRLDCLDLAQRRRAWARAFRLTAAPDLQAVRDYVTAL